MIIKNPIDAGGVGGLRREKIKGSVSPLPQIATTTQAALPLDRSNSLANLAARIRAEHEATSLALKEGEGDAANS